MLEYYGLEYAHEPLSEAAVFGIGGGLDFRFSEAPDLGLPLYLLGRSATFEKDICANLGIELHVRLTDDAEEGWVWLRDELDRGRPTMIWADIKHLDYLDVQLHNTHHDVVVIGYDAGEDVAFISDHHLAEIQRCSLDALRRARASRAYPAPTRHATWLMRFPASLPPYEAAVSAAIRTTVRNMRLEADEEGDVYASLGRRGLSGVDEFVEGFPRWPERSGIVLERALKGVAVFVARAGTGGALFRSFEATFLREAADTLGDAALAAAADLYGELAATWSRLAEGLVGRRRREETEAVHDEACAHVERIGQLEHACVAALESCLEPVTV